jgi:hypothetical protein|tara:strand:- start:298 stop:768 length:471 start_codon:yes stop_codon:yes gene_type:complete
MIPPVLVAVFALLSFSLQSAAPTYLVLETVDADTNQPIPCLVRITDGKGKVMNLPRMLNRGTGLRKNHPASQWYCHEGVGQMKGIIGDLTIEAFAGPEYEKAIGREHVRAGQRVQTKLKLKRIVNPRKAGWRSGNTHLHLMKLSRAQADQGKGSGH